MTEIAPLRYTAVTPTVFGKVKGVMSGMSGWTISSKGRFFKARCGVTGRGTAQFHVGYKDAFAMR